MHFLIDLVDDQDEGATAGTQHPSQFTIQRRESCPPVHNKEKQVGACYRYLCGHMGRLGEIGIRGIADPTRIDDLKGHLARLADSGQTIAGHSGLVVDNRNPPAHEAVEEG